MESIQSSSTQSNQKSNEKDVVQRDIVMLSDLRAVKNFFADNGLKYDDSISRSTNFLINLHRLPVNTDCIYVIDGLSFQVDEGGVAEFPSNYHAKNIQVYGQGELRITNHAPLMEDTVIRSVDRLKSALGVYYPDRSVVWNILHAEHVGNWPTSCEITLRGMCLDITENLSPFFDEVEADEQIFVNRPTLHLPENITIDYSFVNDTNGCVLFCSKGYLLLTGQRAMAAAENSAQLGISAGLGYIMDEGQGFAEQNGIVIGFDDGCKIWADGPTATAIGIDDNVEMHISGGALGVKHVPTVNVHIDDNDPNNRVRLSAAHIQLQNAFEHVIELSLLYMLNDIQAALKLGMVPNEDRRRYLNDDKDQKYYLELAFKLGNAAIAKAACWQLALYYRRKYVLKFSGCCQISEMKQQRENGYIVQRDPSKSGLANMFTVESLGDAQRPQAMAEFYYKRFHELSNQKQKKNGFEEFELNFERANAAG